jgi:ubiquitin-protein ligase E3 A
VCGETKLDFNDLKAVCRYGPGLHPEKGLVAWFWQIVLEEYSDQERRDLLKFATGSDRAPINGLKSLKFSIVLDSENTRGDEKPPSSHTCFN